MNKHGNLIYFVFAGYSYEAIGGMSDFKKAFEFKQDADIYAQSLLDSKNSDWAEVVDITEYTNEPRPVEG